MNTPTSTGPLRSECRSRATDGAVRTIRSVLPGSSTRFPPSTPRFSMTAGWASWSATACCRIPVPNRSSRPITRFRVYALTVTLDYQFIVNPAYNTDRGPVSVVGARAALCSSDRGSFWQPSGSQRYRLHRHDGKPVPTYAPRRRTSLRVEAVMRGAATCRHSARRAHGRRAAPPSAPDAGEGAAASGFLRLDRLLRRRAFWFCCRIVHLVGRARARRFARSLQLIRYV